jgi:hypothetical protein
LQPEDELRKPPSGARTEASFVGMPVDNKALRILTKMWWSSRGWRHPPELPSAEDFAYARDSGLLFDPPQVDHDELPLQIRGWVLRISVDHVAEAFVSSLASRRLDLRSALTSYVIGRAIPIHNFPKRQLDKVAICPVCGPLAQIDQQNGIASASSGITGVECGFTILAISPSTSSNSQPAIIQ